MPLDTKPVKKSLFSTRLQSLSGTGLWMYPYIHTPCEEMFKGERGGNCAVLLRSFARFQQSYGVFVSLKGGSESRDVVLHCVMPYESLPGFARSSKQAGK